MKFKHCMFFLVCRLPLLLGTLALLIFFTGVKPVAAATPAFVRVIHASPDVGTADVFVDGSVLLSSFQFGAVTDYAAVPPGTHRVQIALVGKGIGGALISQDLSVSPGVAYTVAATGTKATGLGLEVFIDDNVVSGSMAKLRVYHLSPDAGNVSVSDNSGTVLSGISYRQASDYVTIPANAYTFNVSATALSSNLSVSVTVKADTITSIFAVGLVKGTPNIQLVSTQANGTPGVPNTGSDPNAVTGVVTTSTSWPLWEAWLLGMLIVGILALGTVSLARRFAR
ncbi:MAG TPA: DUF4397 domain-containing protein [Ktedonobacteraceae bacterium]|nr:DUF4397 domain-containing protein [Ktedonobacteraceae bacterium]